MPLVVWSTVGFGQFSFLVFLENISNYLSHACGSLRSSLTCHDDERLVVVPNGKEVMGSISVY